MPRSAVQWVRFAFTLGLCFVGLACADARPNESAPDAASQPGPGLESALEVDQDIGDPVGGGDATPRVLFLGTSLTAGLGLAEDEAYPSRLAELLEAQGLPIDAVNAGVSGDTSAGGLNRLDWLLREPPDVFVLELGANDGLRGLPVEMTETNLLEAIAKAKDAGAQVIVAGMMMPPNYGEDYARRFAAVFPRVAAETGSTLVPFLLEGVAADSELNLADGIHPNGKGHRQIARTMLPYLVEALQEDPSVRGADSGS